MSGSPGEPGLPFEPYRIKVVEGIPAPTRDQREEALRRAGYNLFNLRSEEVIIDLLTDSGTSAMSDRQWAALMEGDESYAGSRNFEFFEQTVRQLTGFPHIVPAHQGRAAENLLFSIFARKGSVIPNNMHFDTTRAHVRFREAEAMDLAISEAYDPTSLHPFKGNLDVPRLRQLLESDRGSQVPLVMVTLTNNTGGGQPVSLQNLRDVSALCREFRVPFYYDMCRWAENAYFIRTREAGMSGLGIRAIGDEMFRLADGATMSAKKDGLVNIGGFVATRDADVAVQLKEWLILFEGFPTYGGLARRDLGAAAVGLVEATDLSYLEHRVGQVRFLAGLLDGASVPILHPVGGHGVYLDVPRFLPHLTAADHRGQSLVVELYREGGIRTVEIGPVMFEEDGKPGAGRPPPEFVRLAIPRRVYTESHLRHVARTVTDVWRRRDQIRGLRMVEHPRRLPHFTARFTPN